MNDQVDRNVHDILRPPIKAPQADAMAIRMMQAADRVCEITAAGEVVIHKSVSQLDAMAHSPRTEPNIRAIARLVLEIARHREKIKQLERKNGQGPK